MLRSFILTLVVVTALDAAALYLLLRPIHYEPFAYGRHKTEIPAGWVRTASDDAGEDGMRLRFEKPDLDGAWLELSWTPETAPFEAVLDRLEGALRRAEYQRDLEMFGNGRYFIFERPREGERIRYAALFTARKRLYRVEVGTRFSAHAKYQGALFHALEHLRIWDQRPHPSLERELAALRRDTEPTYAQPSSRWLMGGLAVPVAFVIPMWIVWMLAGGRPDAAQLRGERVEREELGVTVRVRKRRGGGEYLSAVYLTDQFFRAFTSGRPLLVFPLYYPGERLVAVEKMRGGRWLHIRLGEYPDTDYFFHVADAEAWAGEIERKFGELSGVRQRVAEEVSRDNREVSLVDRAYEGRAETVLE
ncbi:MAG: hypothetical protein K8I02_06260, partial [Candidatus Methylomirabilis sp.]|nr:hypothetical protein [Deltaproteobacteria bacterium]